MSFLSFKIKFSIPTYVQFTHSFAITDITDRVSGNMETDKLYASRKV